MNSNIIPDQWLLVQITTDEGLLTKVFASWHGGYLHGASWRMNSGITRVTEDPDYYYFYGHSGSCYQCHKSRYGVNLYATSILSQLEKQCDYCTILYDEPDIPSLFNLQQEYL